MRRYTIMTYSASRDHTKGGFSYPKGSVTEYVITDRTREETEVIRKANDGDHVMDSWAAITFPVNAQHDAETQKARANLMLNYMNKVVDAQEKAALGAEIGFLN